MEEKIQRIVKDFREKESAVVAFSGGVDSSVVSCLAYKALGNKALAVTAKSSIFPAREVQDAERVAEEIGIPHQTIKVNHLGNARFKENSSSRCYFCKKQLLTELKKLAEEEGFKCVVEGTNASDTEGHRPGLQAIKELNVFTPLIDHRISKEIVRQIAGKLGLSVADKPSMACLATRIPYSEEISLEKLRKIEEGEKFLTHQGFKQVRIRTHIKGEIARIELPPTKRKLKRKKMEKINRKLKKLGFTYVTLDLQGYRTGSMNKTMKQSDKNQNRN